MMNSNSASALNSPFAAAARRRPRSPVRLTLLWPGYGTLDVVLDFLWQQGLNPTSLEGELESPFKDDEPVGAEEPALVKERAKPSTSSISTSPWGRKNRHW